MLVTLPISPYPLWTEGCPKLHTISQVWPHLCCTVGSAASTRKAGLGCIQALHKGGTPKGRADSDKLFLACVAPYGSQLGWFGCGSGWKTPKFLNVCSQNCVWVGSVKFVVLHQSELFVLANVQTSKQTNKNRNGKKVWAVPPAMGLINLGFLWVCDLNVSTHVDLMMFHKSWSPASTFLSGHPFIFSLTL